MAGMDLSTRRNAPGVSVFWMILASGAGIFLLLAIVVLTTESLSVADVEAIENRQDEVVLGAEDEDLQSRPVAEVGVPSAAEVTAQGERVELVAPTEEALEAEEVEAAEGRPVAADAALPEDTIAIPAEVGSTAPVAEEMGLPEDTVAIPAEAGPQVTPGDNDNLGPAAEDVVVPTLSDPVGPDDEDPLATE